MLASGSGGNSIVVRSSGSGIMVDAGLSCRETLRRLELCGAGTHPIDALFISHGHHDHVSAAGPLCRRLDLPVYASRGTLGEARNLAALQRACAFSMPDSIRVGGLEVSPFPVPHDAAEPVGFVVTDGRSKVGIATDLGSVTLEVIQALSGCDALVLESNHDVAMLVEGPYPWFLKKRIMGPRGHLSNMDACELIRGLYHPGLQHLVLAHVSRTNNTRQLPMDEALAALGLLSAAVRIHVGSQYEPCEVIRLE